MAKRNKIKEALRDYRHKKAQMQATLECIRAYQEILQNNKLHLLKHINRQPEPGMPRAHSNTSPVEREVCGKEKAQEVTKEELQEWIDMDFDSLWLLRLELTQIDAALDSLTQQERFIIERKYMDNLNWSYIELSYQEQYNQQLTDRTLQNYNCTAMQKINAILKPFYDKFKHIL